MFYLVMAVVGVPLGIYMVYSAISGVRTGVVEEQRGWTRRSKNPISFWVGVVMNVVMGLVFILASWAYLFFRY